MRPEHPVYRVGRTPGRRVAKVGVYVLPDDGLFGSHFKDAAGSPFTDQRVAVGLALGAADIVAVE